MKAKTVIGVSSIITASSYIAYKKISNDIFKKIFYRNDKDYIIEEEYSNWLKESNVTDAEIESFDGLKLKALNVSNHETNNYVILVHGISNNKYGMLDRAFGFDSLGYNTLIIDQRSAGESQGEYYSYGFKESLDITLWIDYLIKNNPDVNIVLYGVSMGASTVMLSLNQKLPKNVKCVIEDCGYSSMEEEIDYVIRKEHDLKYTKLILKLIEKQMIDKFGYSFEDVNVKKGLDKNEIPIMFIHGMEDELVPYEMSKKLYNHNLGEKKFYPVPNEGHCFAINDPNYFNHINNFIEKNLL